MSLLIPLRSELDHFEEQVLLDGVTFDLFFIWNERDEAWYMSIFDPTVVADEDGARTPIIGCIPIHVGQMLLNEFSDRRRPLGDIVAVDTSNEDLDPGQRDLGERVILLYLSNADLVAIASEA